MISLLILSFLMSGGQSTSSSRPVADNLLVAKFLAAAQDETSGGAQPLLSPSAEMRYGPRFEPRSLEEFADYARACRLETIDVSPSNGERTSVYVQWYCRRPEPDRRAQIRIENGLIMGVTWGPPLRVQYDGVPIPTPPANSQPDGRR